MVVDAVKAVALPDAIADEQGAMFFVNPFTAYVMTREVLRVPRGQWLLVTAAGSALGKSVVRLGKLFGFKTLCIVRSDSNSDALRALGADAIDQVAQEPLRILSLGDIVDIAQVATQFGFPLDQHHIIASKILAKTVL